MAEFDFDKLTDRKGINSLKWDISEGELPLWVADMDFEVCPAIVEAMTERLKKPTFGYNVIGDDWYGAYINWWRTRHSFNIEREWLTFSTGVVPSLSSVVRRLTLPAEKVVILTPAYNIFFNSIVNNGRVVEECPLAYVGGAYSIDFGLLEKKLSDPQTRMMIFCNPHNPVGKNWSAEEIERVGELCVKYGVVVVSDEIHCDVQRTDASYVPFMSVSDKCKYNCVTLIAPTKAFNLAGLQTSAIVVADPSLRRRVERGVNNDEIAEPNSFATLAAVAAFNEGGEWLEAMNLYVGENARLASEFIKSELPALKVVEGEATYLLWIDCRAYGTDSLKLCNEIRKRTGLYLCHGSEYGAAGEGFLRMNIACPRARLEDALSRLKAALSGRELSGA